MTFKDWLDDSVTRFKNKPPRVAARRSAREFAAGIFLRVGGYLGKPIWHHGDFDVMLVLDACRTDLMQEVIVEYDSLPDRVDTRWSNASCSIDWQLRNWKPYPNRVRDAAYVCANPFADHDWPDCRSADLTNEPIGYFAPLYQTDWQEVVDGIATVPPEAVTNHTITAWRRRGELEIDQLVAHYMQPHEPYIARPDWGDGDHRLLENLIDPSKQAGTSIWPELREGHVDRDEFWEVYKENLRWVLDDIVENLLPNIDGKVVLTADHGNALGEWGEWHHPPGAIGPAVRRVPWVEIDCSDHGEYQPAVELHAEGDGDVDTEGQLEALGYL